MRTEDVLATSETGVWTWDGARGVIALDAVAAGLLGLPEEAVTLPESAVRARLATEDIIETERVLAVAESEGRVTEVRQRVIGEDGTVLRTIRSRLRPIRDGRPAVDGITNGMVGTMAEVPAAPGRPASMEWDWRRAREAFVLDAGQALSEAHTSKDVMRVAGSLAMPGFTPDGVAVFVQEGDEIQLADYHGAYLDGMEDRYPMPIDRSYPAADVLRTGRAVYLATPDEYERQYPETFQWVRHFERCSWAYLPLVVAGRVTGVWLVAFSTPVGFTIEDRSLLSTIARLLAQALSRAFLQDTERELAADLQHTMRPGPAPGVPGMQIATRYVPTGGGLRVGGDWYDVIPLPSGRVALIIGDVQGHDVRAAAVMAQLRIVLRAYASEGHHPDAVLSRASRFLSGLTAEPDPAFGESRFATCLYAEVDPSTGTLEIARAGHLDPAMVLEDGTMVTRPTAGGLPLGVTGQEDYPTTRLILQPGETLLLCTDGLIETGKHDMETGWARLRKAVEGAGGLKLDDLADTLVETVQGGRAPRPGDAAPSGERDLDDIALVLLRRTSAARAGPPGGAPVRRVVLTIAQSEPARIAEARDQLAALLHDWTHQERLSDAVLMLSEVVTNVLTHTDGDALLVAELSGSTGDRLLRVEVSDPSDEPPHRRDPGELASSGRGLLLMDSLSDAWGYAPRGAGKTTWFELHEAASGG
ncbi:SpoIIE family protein phosphatase [Streptomyces radicis]|uniref:protein-serine/threonine phosphatase n=1 Tax=Streptomyces radicis TaxID=1750517 RepID=A0A3A9WFK9_9ACTN|nr:SpoIIE family protein phosphatase [Streptomyces radicis]RKN11382.1 GAF domain-containing protein [Streptomyces radicis]RKN26598.1 GAF domain-containing protein [Streptomyces radicis]